MTNMELVADAAGRDDFDGFWSRVEASHPNTEVRVAWRGRNGFVTNAGSVARDWRSAQAEIARLTAENESLHRIVARLTER